MKYTQCGKLGELSVMGLGCWNFGAQWNKTTERDAITIIRTAIDGGINYVDVAESYGEPDGQCEIILGKALRDGYREKVFLVSKVGWHGRRQIDNMTAKDGFLQRQIKRVFNKLYRFKTVDLQQRTPEIVRLSGHACCGRLQTDHIDLLLCHDGSPKDVMPFIDGFRQLKNEGFIRFYGISTDSLATLKKFYETSNGECAACECDYSLLNRNAEDGLFKFCLEHNIAILTRGTLCRGLLSGKYNLDTVFTEQSRLMWNKGGINRWQYEHFITKIDALKSTLKTETLTEYAYRYAFSRPEHPTVVMGCTSLDQLKKNLEIGSSYLGENEIKKIERVCAKTEGGGIKILLLGGSGTLSKAVLALAYKDGYSITVLNRGKKSNQVPVGVESVICDIFDETSLKAQLEGREYDVVVDFLSRRPSDINRLFPLYKSKCKQYIFISSACVYRRAEGDFPIRETSPKPNKDWSYNIEKYECERKLIELAKESSAYYTIIRPYITYDSERIPFGIAPEYKYHRTLIERIKSGKPMFVWDNGQTMATSTYVSEFAVGVVGLFLNPKAVNEDFHITSCFNYPVKELLFVLCKKLNANNKIVEIPCTEVAKWLPNYASMLKGDRCLPAVFDNSKIKEAVPEYESKMTLSDGVNKIIEYYSNLTTYDYDYRYEGQIDRMLNKRGVKCNYVAYPHSEGKDRYKYYLNRYIPYAILRKIKIG